MPSISIYGWFLGFFFLLETNVTNSYVKARGLQMLLQNSWKAYHGKSLKRRRVTQEQNNLKVQRTLLGTREVTFLQLFFKLFNFFLKLTEQGILGIFINSGLILDVFGTVGISECADSLIIIIVCRTNICTLLHKKKRSYLCRWDLALRKSLNDTNTRNCKTRKCKNRPTPCSANPLL